jgi:hypothetical protein
VPSHFALPDGFREMPEAEQLAVIHQLAQELFNQLAPSELDDLIMRLARYRTVATWRQIIVGDHKSWVLFAHGTCVVLPTPAEDLVGQATGILREYGPVGPGSPAGDFGVIELTAAPGWVVTGDHPDVINYVAPGEVAQPSDDIRIGLTGRAKRDRDGHELTVVHIEDKRT